MLPTSPAAAPAASIVVAPLRDRRGTGKSPLRQRARTRRAPRPRLLALSPDGCQPLARKLLNDGNAASSLRAAGSRTATERARLLQGKGFPQRPEPRIETASPSCTSRHIDGAGRGRSQAMVRTRRLDCIDACRPQSLTGEFSWRTRPRHSHCWRQPAPRAMVLGHCHQRSVHPCLVATQQGSDTQFTDRLRDCIKRASRSL